MLVHKQLRKLLISHAHFEDLFHGKMAILNGHKHKLLLAMFPFKSRNFPQQN